MTAAAGAAASPLLHSVWLNFQPDHGSNKILGSEWLLMQGPEWAWQDFGGVQLALAPGSFVQVGCCQLVGPLGASAGTGWLTCLVLCRKGSGCPRGMGL
jgi:hypothetical protein